MPSNGVASDGGGALQGRRVVERPGIGANPDAQVEELLALDIVVRDTDTSVAAAILGVDHINGAEAHVVRRGDDGVARDGASRRAEDDDTPIRRAVNLSTTCKLTKTLHGNAWRHLRCCLVPAS